MGNTYTAIFYAGSKPYEELKRNILEKWHTPDEKPIETHGDKYDHIWYIKVWGGGRMKHMPQVVSGTPFSQLDIGDLLEPFHVLKEAFEEEYPETKPKIYKVEVSSFKRVPNMRRQNHV